MLVALQTECCWVPSRLEYARRIRCQGSSWQLRRTSPGFRALVHADEQQQTIIPLDQPHECSPYKGRPTYTDGRASSTHHHPLLAPDDEECFALLGACESHKERLIMLLLQRVALRNGALRHLLLSNLIVSDEDEEDPIPFRAMRRSPLLSTCSTCLQGK